MERAVLSIEGMSCAHCVRAVTKALEGMEGVAVERVGVGSAEVSFDPAVVGPEGIAAAVAEEGYPVRSIGRER